MKKMFILSAILCFLTTTSQATEAQKIVRPNATQKFIQEQKVEKNIQQKADFEKMKRKHDMMFEQKLKLTEVQKLKARNIRKQGHEALEPIMNEIRNKKQEAEMVRRSRIAVQVQEERLTAIDKELAILEKKANEIRKNNMKEFESILTKEQKKNLKEMKKDGRKRFAEKHKKPSYRR